MKVCIYSGVISLSNDNSDVRKNYLLERVKYFGQRNFILKILSPYSSSIEYLKYDNIAYEHYLFTNYKGLKLLSSMLFSLPHLFRVDCDILHCLNYQSFLVGKIVNLFRVNKYIILFEAMGLAYAESAIDSKSSMKVKLLRPIISRLERYAFNKSDGVIVYTEILKNYVSHHFNVKSDNIFVVPHGVNLDNSFAVNSEVAKEKISKTNPVVMYVGSLSELHGTPNLMKVCMELHSKRNEISIYVLGTGVLEDKFKQFINDNNIDNVHMLGFISSEQIPLYLSKADVLLIPHSKCLQTELDAPTKLFEYLKSGIPIVSFDYEAISEVVGSNAILVEPDDVHEFTKGIIEVLDNEEYYSEIAKNACSIVDNYSWENSAKRLYETYCELYVNHNG
jgi:glycosyltransferase involved in cell wall biosynthesis